MKWIHRCKLKQPFFLVIALAIFVLCIGLMASLFGSKAMACDSHNPVVLERAIFMDNGQILQVAVTSMHDYGACLVLYTFPIISGDDGQQVLQTAEVILLLKAPITAPFSSDVFDSIPGMTAPTDGKWADKDDHRIYINGDLTLASAAPVLGVEFPLKFGNLA